MDVISDHSKAPGGQDPEPQFDRRIRWGNVALALAALVAIVAAIGLPQGSTADSARQSVTPVTGLVTESVPTAATAKTVKPRQAREPGMRAKRKPHKVGKTNPSPAKRPIPVAPAPTPDPAPAPPAPNQAPAAEREFGL